MNELERVGERGKRERQENQETPRRRRRGGGKKKKKKCTDLGTPPKRGP